MTPSPQYRLERVRKVFGREQVALEGFDLEVGRGERVALIGPSGAGKTTLFRMLNCTLRPTSGRLRIGGEEAAELYGRRLRQMRRRIGTIYQQHNLVPRLRVVHNVLSGGLGDWSLLGSLASLVRPFRLETAHRALADVGIGEKLFSRTDELSGGQQQRVAIARVLVQDPDVILADEPVSSVDPSLAEAIIKLLIAISENTPEDAAGEPAQHRPGAFVFHPGRRHEGGGQAVRHGHRPGDPGAPAGALLRPRPGRRR